MKSLLKMLVNPFWLMEQLTFYAFVRANFAPIGNQSNRGKAPAHWSYRTDDALATVDGAGYFDNGSTTNTGMRNVLSIGDLIYVAVVDDVDTPTSCTDAGHVVVLSNASGIVDTSDESAIVVTDGD